MKTVMQATRAGRESNPQPSASKTESPAGQNGKTTYTDTGRQSSKLTLVATAIGVSAPALEAMRERRRELARLMATGELSLDHGMAIADQMVAEMLLTVSR